MLPRNITRIHSFSGHPANAGLSGSGSSVSNLNLISTSNEVKGEKSGVRQQIPVKLSSKLSVSSGGSTKDKSRKSVAGLGKVGRRKQMSSKVTLIHPFRSCHSTGGQLVERLVSERFHGEHCQAHRRGLQHPTDASLQAQSERRRDRNRLLHLFVRPFEFNEEGRKSQDGIPGTLLRTSLYIHQSSDSSLIFISPYLANIT